MPPRKVPLPPPKARERRASAVRKSFVEPGENDLFDDDDEPAAKVARRAAPATEPAAASSLASSGAPVTSASAAERLLAGETPLERCAVALDYLSSLDAEGWFQQPVTDDIAPGYSEFVQEPMDLSTVRTKLADGEYGTDDELVVARFADDVRLIYRNAVTFNWQPDNIVGASAVVGLTGFERILPLVVEGKQARGAGQIVRKAVRTRAPRERAARRSDDEAHRRLVAFVEACGGHAGQLEGWRTHTDERMDGHSAGI